MVSTLLCCPVGSLGHILFSSLIRPWIPPKHGLDLCYQRTVYGTYGHHEAISRIPDIKWFMEKRSIGKGYHLVMTSIYNKRIFPIIDADSESDMILASMWLDENNIKYSILSSSPDHYWVIADSPERRWRRVRKFLEFPGQDGNYRSFCDNHRMMYLRAEMKDEYYVPQLIENSGSGSDEFASAIIDHFVSDRVRWLYRLSLYKSGNVDLSNPNVTKFNMSSVLGD